MGDLTERVRRARESLAALPLSDAGREALVALLDDLDPAGTQTRAVLASIGEAVRAARGELSGTPLREALVAAGRAAALLGRPDRARACLAEAMVLARQQGEEAVDAALEAELAELDPPASGGGTGFEEAIAAILTEHREARSPAQLVSSLLARAIQAVGATGGLLAAYRGGQLVDVATEGLGPDPLDEPIVGHALWDLAEAVEPSRWAAPLGGGAEPLGVLMLAGQVPASPRRQCLVAALGAAMAQHAMVDALGARIECLALSEGIQRAALAGAPREEVYRLGLGELVRLAGGDRAFLLAGEALTPVAAVDGRGGALASDARPSRSVCRHVFDTATAVRMLDAQNSEQWGSQQSIQAMDLRTIVAAPVLREGVPAGVLYVDSADVMQRLGAREQALLEAAAGAFAPLV